MLNGCKGVVFDFNGTLFFDSDKHVLAWNKLSEDLRGVGITPEELQTHFYGVSNNRAIEYLLQRECDEAELTKYSERKEAYYRELYKADTENFHLVEGAVEFFDFLKANKIPFAIASASIKANIDFFVESFGLDQWFTPERIIYDDGSFANKAEMFHRSSCVIGVPVEDCMIFEDSESGIHDALKAGCTNVVVVDSMGVAQRYSGMAGITKIIRTFMEMDSRRVCQGGR